MAAKGYSTNAKVGEELGVTLTAAQLAQVDGLIEEAEAWIDEHTGDAWLVTSPTTDELHVPDGGVVYLKHTPVSAITSVVARSLAIGASATTLVANTDYELIDAARGTLRISGTYWGFLLRVTYTHTSMPVPKHVQRATTLLVAHWMLPRLNPDRQGVESYEVGGEIAVKMRKDAENIPEQVLALLKRKRRLVFA